MSLASLVLSSMSVSMTNGLPLSPCQTGRQIRHLLLCDCHSYYVKTYIAKVFAASVGAHIMVENFCISVQFLTLRVGDDLLDGVVEDFRTRSIFIRNPPSFDDGQFAFVLVVGFRRRQTNGRNCLGELDGRLQRQDGDVVGLICLTIISVIIDQWIINWHSSIQL